MKKFLLALLASSTLFAASCQPVSARTIATMPNEAGGEVRLTNIPCPTKEKEQLIAYAIGKGGVVITGCFTLISDDEVLVLYDSGDLRIYPLESFTLKEQKKAPKTPTTRPFYKAM